MIVCWHGISKDEEHTRWPTIFTAPEAFRRQLEYLQRNYSVVSLAEAVRQHKAGHIQLDQVVLTFDEGFENFYSVAAPILRELRMPATVYVHSRYVDNCEPHAVLIIQDMIKRARKDTVTSPVPGCEGEFNIHDHQNRLKYSAHVMNYYRTLPEESQASFAEELAKILDVNVTEQIARKTWHALTPEQMAELSEDELFSFELHTHDHLNVVDNLSSTEAQIQLNRESVERVTQTPATHFCYPSGRWSRAAWPILERSGIQSSTTTAPGPNFVRTPRFAMRRVLSGAESQLEFEFGMSNFRWLLTVIRHPSQWNCPFER